MAGLQGFEPQLSDPESGDRLPAHPAYSRMALSAAGSRPVPSRQVPVAAVVVGVRVGVEAARAILASTRPDCFTARPPMADEIEHSPSSPALLPLVGREREQALLRDALTSALAGR